MTKMSDTKKKLKDLIALKKLSRTSPSVILDKIDLLKGKRKKEEDPDKKAVLKTEIKKLKAILEEIGNRGGGDDFPTYD